MNEKTSPQSGSTRLLPGIKRNPRLTETQKSYPSANSKELPAPEGGYGSRSTSSDDLKRENANLRIKLHEMQALVLEGAVKNKEKGSNDKGMESSLVKANAKLYKLEGIIKQKDEKIQQVLLEKKLLENIKREQSKTLENLNNDKNLYLKAGQDLQAELQSLKKGALHGLADEKKALKEQLAQYEKKMNTDKNLIHKQLQTIKLLDEKLSEISRARHQTLNPLYDSSKRNDLYRNKQLVDIGQKSELETISALNLAFSTDEVLEKLLEEQDKELEEEEKKKNPELKDTKDAKDAKGSKDSKDKKGKDGKEEPPQPEEPPKEVKIVNWEQEYKKLRGVYIETRFEFEHIDTKLKEEINGLTKKVNELEQRLREKDREYDSLNNALNSKIQSNAERIANRKTSPKKVGKFDKNADVSNVGHEPDNQTSFHDDVKEILKLGVKSDSIEEAEDKDDRETRRPPEDRETKRPMEEIKISGGLPKGQEVIDDGEPLIKLGQFNKDSAFDDRHELAKFSVKRLDSLSLWVDNKSILGIQVNFETKEGKIFEGPRHMGDVTKEKYAQEPWKLEAGDSLTRIRGAVAITHGIIWIEFFTKKGVVKKFGNSEIGKESFDQHFAENEVPLIVVGSFSARERGDKPAKSNLSCLGIKVIKTEPTPQASVREEKTDKKEKHDEKPKHPEEEGKTATKYKKDPNEGKEHAGDLKDKPKEQEKEGKPRKESEPKEKKETKEPKEGGKEHAGDVKEKAKVEKKEEKKDEEKGKDKSRKPSGEDDADKKSVKSSGRESKTEKKDEKQGDKVKPKGI